MTSTALPADACTARIKALLERGVRLTAEQIAGIRTNIARLQKQAEDAAAGGNLDVSYQCGGKATGWTLCLKMLMAEVHHAHRLNRII